MAAIGLMSGTSLDGIDAALLVTDGERATTFAGAITVPYPAAFRARLRAMLGRCPGPADADLISALTDRHADAVETLLRRSGRPPGEIDVIGFHGQTVLHRPERGVTVQIGDGERLAQRTGIAVVDSFRAADVAAGGQGAPLAPLYHAALARALAGPVAVVNIGGVANVTWIGAARGAAPAPVLAFDTGPGNALIDDWLATTTGAAMDQDGRHAARGRVDTARLDALLGHPFFAAPPPKSLDREAFAAALASLDGLSVDDGAATLSAFTALSIARAQAFFPEGAKRWLVCGGGRRNPVLLARLAEAVAAPVDPVEAVGWRGDSLEAEAFAYLAVRSLRGLPLSLPTTTGVAAPLTGGVVRLPQPRR
ncbi:MAG: anhydro-N-acetylmuramic acid kinase [Rhodospirillales bacterium]|nr:anhydro-N-acetylmuramic acid kinase [Rhodospirillales bacterium]